MIGSVGELFQVETKYEMAFQSALGNWTKCLVAKDKISAMKIILKAKSKKLGNFSILPLKELEKFKIERPSIPKAKGILGSAIDLCGVDKSNSNLAEALIGSLLVVNDVNEIKNKSILNEWDLVDLQGTFVGKNLLLKYRNKSKDTSIIGRQKKVQIIEKQIKTLDSTKSKINPCIKKPEFCSMINKRIEKTRKQLLGLNLQARIEKNHKQLIGKQKKD